MIASATAAFRVARTTSKPRKPRTPLIVKLARFAGRVLPRWANVRRFTLHVGGFAAIDYALYEVAAPAGYAAIGVSLLLLDYLAGDK
jgi:hypothetical protein